MKEPSHNTIPTTNVATKWKRRKGGTSFSNSKQKKQRELKKNDLTSIEGKMTPSDLSKLFAIDETWYSNPQLNLHPIEEEREDSGSRAPSMAENEHRTNSNKNGSREETKEDSISTVSLSWVLSPLEVEQDFGFWN
jgi:hypothetical protein